MFITTANSVDTIPRPLLDRMELIEVSGYTEDEKLNIAKQHLLPRQIEEHGLAARSVRISDKVMRSLIRGYTLEAGVRRLQRTIGKVVRKSAVEMIDENIETVTVTPETLEKFLGAPRFHYEKAGKKPEVGVVNGSGVYRRRRRHAANRNDDHAGNGCARIDGQSRRRDEGERPRGEILCARACG